MTRRQIISLLVLTVIFFVVGLYEYENLYELTLYSVTILSSVPLSFYGKFPFWFGDIRFSLIISSMPLTIFLISKILKQSRFTLTIAAFTYVIYLVCSYIVVCIATGLSFHVSNDFYNGGEIEKNLTEININKIFLTTIVLTIFATSLTFLLANFIRWTQIKISQKNSR